MSKKADSLRRTKLAVAKWANADEVSSESVLGTLKPHGNLAALREDVNSKFASLGESYTPITPAQWKDIKLTSKVAEVRDVAHKNRSDLE